MKLKPKANCPNCGTIDQLDIKYDKKEHKHEECCPHCGTSKIHLISYCLVCGERIPSDASFCYTHRERKARD